MSNQSIPKLKSIATPLSSDERAICDRVAARLHADLGQLINQLPLAAQTGSGMSKQLKVVRNTCQRVVHAIKDEVPNAHTLIKFPGIKGLEQLVQAIENSGISKESCGLASNAIAQFDQLIQSIAGSHAKLASRINAVGASDSKSPLGAIESRKQLFESAIGVTGRSAATSLSLYAFRQSPENPDVLQRAIASGLLQTTVVPGGMPIVIRNGDTLNWDDPQKRTTDYLDDSKPAGNTPEALLKEFTTHPLPTVSSQGSSDNLVQVIDPAEFASPQTLDVITAARSNHPYRDPRTDKLTLDEVWSLVNCPSARLLFDIYLHKDLERTVRPRIDAQLWYPNLSSPGGQRWITRYPSPPRLELLGEGIINSASASHPRHQQLTNTLFNRVDWDPSEFVGFRCEVMYPIWRAGYCMSFHPVDSLDSSSDNDTGS